MGSKLLGVGLIFGSIGTVCYALGGWKVLTAVLGTALDVAAFFAVIIAFFTGVALLSGE